MQIESGKAIVLRATTCFGYYNTQKTWPVDSIRCTTQRLESLVCVSRNPIWPRHMEKIQNIMVEVFFSEKKNITGFSIGLLNREEQKVLWVQRGSYEGAQLETLLNKIFLLSHMCMDSLSTFSDVVKGHRISIR